MANVGRFFDRPHERHIIPAGKSEFHRMETAAKALEPFQEDTPPAIVTRHLRKTQPAPGAQTWNFNHVSVPESHTFGGTTGLDNESVSSLMSPAIQSKFAAAVEQAQHPTQRASLGRSRNVKVANHEPPVPSETVFGITGHFESSTAECMDFPKLDADVEKTAKAMYIVSHGAVGPGEQTKRNYTDTFSTTKSYGMPTPHSKEGKSLAQNMKWINDARAEKVTPLISAAARDYAERYGDKLGAPAEPLRDTREAKTFEETHMYGSVPEEASDSVSALFDAGMGAEDDEDALLTSLTGPLSFAATEPFVTTEKIEFAGTKALSEEFVDIDVTQNDRVTGLVDRHIAVKMLEKHNVPMDASLLPNVAKVNYKALIQELETGELRTTNATSIIQTGKLVRSAGHGTIRTDLVPPRVKSVMEFRNFGNEGGVGTVLTPNSATRNGLDDYELGVGRTRAQIETIFKNAGLEATHDFEKVWASAQQADGTVSFNSFQKTLDAMI